MGDPRRIRKKWRGPRHPWRSEALSQEMRLIGAYGLRNKTELWKVRTLLRRFRRQAREILALPAEKRDRRSGQTLAKLSGLGLLGENPTLDDVLGLRVEDLLERRLQTIAFRRGLTKTVYQARQYVIHGHVSVAGSRVTSPGYLVSKDDYDKIALSPTSPIATEAAVE